MRFEPVIREHEGVIVVRDDYIAGGSKRRFVDKIIRPYSEVVYASPVYGGAQIAIAAAAQEAGKRSTIFCAKRKEPHSRTLEAKKYGATIVQIPYGYLSNVRAKARQYCEATGAHLLPFGLDCPLALTENTGVARYVAKKIGAIDEVWCVGGSGFLAKSLRAGFPRRTSINIVQVGRDLNVGSMNDTFIYRHYLKFEQNARVVPPFPSCSNYDAKAWEFIKKYSKGSSLFWNVMS